MAVVLTAADAGALGSLVTGWQASMRHADQAAAAAVTPVVHFVAGPAVRLAAWPAALRCACCRACVDETAPLALTCRREWGDAFRDGSRLPQPGAALAGAWNFPSLRCAPLPFLRPSRSSVYWMHGRCEACGGALVYSVD